MTQGARVGGRARGQGTPGPVPRACRGRGSRARWLSLFLAGSAGSLGAQVNLPSLPPPPEAMRDLPRLAWRQSLVLRGAARGYAVDERRGSDASIAERAGGITYLLRGARLAFRTDVTPVVYGATLGGGSTTQLAGITPVQMRLDWRWRDGDTTRFYVRSGTRPIALDTAQSQALGAAGTSTLDLDAMAFGAQPMAGVRHAVRVSLGDANSLSFRTAAEVSPRPGGVDFTYWTGTTLRGGVAWQRLLGAAASARVSADVSRSFAGDLDGRNLFPGGGNLVLDARTSGLLDGEDGRWFGAVQGFWSRPFANPNADNFARLIPQGQFGGVQALLTAEVGSLSIGPTASLLRESSAADARFLIAAPNGGRPVSNTVRKEGSGWSVAGGLTATWEVVEAVDLTLDAALTRGGVDLRQREELRAPGGRPISAIETRRENTISGGWVALEVTLRW